MRIKQAFYNLFKISDRGNESRKQKPRWLLLGSSVQGSSHRRHNLPCQDAHRAGVLGKGIAIIVCADGAGSAKRSQEGSRRAADALFASLKTQLAHAPSPLKVEWKRTIVGAFAQACQAVEELARKKGLPTDDFATTLSCAIISDQGLAVGNIGDGMIVAQGTDDSLFVAAPPQRGEYANETYFITSRDSVRALQTAYCPQRVEAVIAMSDGIWPLAVKRGKSSPSPDFFEPLLSFARKQKERERSETRLASFLSSQRVSSLNRDDKTLVMTVRSRPHPQRTTEAPTERRLVSLMRKTITSMRKRGRILIARLEVELIERTLSFYNYEVRSRSADEERGGESSYMGMKGK